MTRLTAERWAVEAADDNTVHVHPLQDSAAHELTDDCVCGTRNEPVFRDDGSCGWVIVHHSLDGRESTEVSATND